MSSSLSAPEHSTSAPCVVDLLTELLQRSAVAVSSSSAPHATSGAQSDKTAAAAQDAPPPLTSSSTQSSLHGTPTGHSPSRHAHDDGTVNANALNAASSTEDLSRIHALCEQIVDVLVRRERAWCRSLVCVEVDPEAVPAAPYVMDGEEELGDAARLHILRQQQQDELYLDLDGSVRGEPRYRIRKLTETEQREATASWPAVLVRDAHLQRCLARAVELLEQKSVCCGSEEEDATADSHTYAAQSSTTPPGEGNHRGGRGLNLSSSSPAPSGRASSRNSGSKEGLAGVYDAAPPADSTLSSCTCLSWTPTALRSREDHREAATDGGSGSAGPSTPWLPSTGAWLSSADAHSAAPTVGTEKSSVDLEKQLERFTTTSSRTLTTCSRPMRQLLLRAASSSTRVCDANSGSHPDEDRSPAQQVARPSRFRVAVPSLLHAMLGNDRQAGESLTAWMESRLRGPVVKAVHTYRCARTDERVAAPGDGSPTSGRRQSANDAPELSARLHRTLGQLIGLPAPDAHQGQPDSALPHALSGDMLNAAMPLVVGVVYRRTSATPAGTAEPAAGEGDDNASSAAAGPEDLLTSWGVEALEASGLRIRLLPAEQVAGANAQTDTAATSREDQADSNDGVSTVSSMTCSSSITQADGTALPDGRSHASRRSAPTPAPPADTCVPPARFCACILELSGTVRDVQAAQRVWCLLVSIVQFVHVVGTREFVETAAHLVAHAVRARRRVRASAVRVHPLKAAQEGSLADVSAPITVLAFFFTLDPEVDGAMSTNDSGAKEPETASRPATTDAVRDPSVQLFPPAFGTEEGGSPGSHPHTRTNNVERRDVTAAAVAPPSSSLSTSPRLAPPPQLTSLATTPRTRGDAAASTAAPGDDNVQARPVAEWMHRTLIPIFYEISYELVAPDEADASPGEGPADRSVTPVAAGASVSAPGGSRSSSRRSRRRGPRRKKKTSLLARVQFVSDAHVDLLHCLVGEALPPLSDNGAVGPTRAGEGVLLRFILLRQLFFRELVELAVGHYTASVRGEPPSSTAKTLSAAAPMAGGEPVRSSALPVEVEAEAAAIRRAQASPAPVAAGGASPPGVGKRRVSFNDTPRLHHLTAPATLSAVHGEDAQGSVPQSPLSHGDASVLSAHSSVVGTPMPVAARSASAFNTPVPGAADVSVLSVSAPQTDASMLSAVSPVKSILKSGHRYRVAKLIRNSAPAMSIVPFNNTVLWRCLVAEQLVAACAAVAEGADEAHTGDAPAAPSPAPPGQIDDWSWASFFHLTSDAYTAHVNTVVTRTLDEVGCLLVSGALREAVDDAATFITPSVGKADASASFARRDVVVVDADKAAGLCAELGAASTRPLLSSGAAPARLPCRDLGRQEVLRQLAHLAEVLANTLNAPVWNAQLNPSGAVQHVPDILVSAAQLAGGAGRRGPTTAAVASAAARVSVAQSSLSRTIWRPAGGAEVACSVLAPILPLSVSSRFRLYCEVSARTSVIGALLCVGPAMDANLRVLAYAALRDNLHILAKPLVRYVSEHLLDTPTPKASVYGEAPLPLRTYAEVQEQSVRLIAQLGAHLTGVIVLPRPAATAAFVHVDDGRAAHAESAESCRATPARRDTKVREVPAPSWPFRAPQHGDRLTDIISHVLQPLSQALVPGEASQFDLESALLPPTHDATASLDEDFASSVDDDDDVWSAAPDARSASRTDGDTHPQRPSFGQWPPPLFTAPAPPQNEPETMREGRVDVLSPAGRGAVADVRYVTGVRENALLRPWLKEAKQVMLSSLLGRWFWPLWTSWAARFAARTASDNAPPPKDETAQRATPPARAPPPPPSPPLPTADGAAASRVGLGPLRDALVDLMRVAAHLEGSLAEMAHTLSHGHSLPLPNVLLPLRMASASASPPRQPGRRVAVPATTSPVGSGSTPSSLPNAPLTPPRIGLDGELLPDLPPRGSPPAVRSLPTPTLAVTPFALSGAAAVDGSTPRTSPGETAGRRRVSFSDGPPPGEGVDGSGSTSPLTMGEFCAVEGTASSGSHDAPPHLPQRLAPFVVPLPAAQSPRTLSPPLAAQLAHAQASQLVDKLARLARGLISPAEAPPPPDLVTPPTELPEPLSMGFQGSRCTTPSDEELHKAALSRVASQRYAPLHLDGAAASHLSVSQAGAMTASAARGIEDASFFGAPLVSPGTSNIMPLTAEAQSAWAQPSDSVLTLSPHTGSREGEGAGERHHRCRGLPDTAEASHWAPDFQRPSDAATAEVGAHDVATQTQSDHATRVRDVEPSAVTLHGFAASASSNATTRTPGSSQPRASPPPVQSHSTSPHPSSGSGEPVAPLRRSPSVALALDPVHFERPRAHLDEAPRLRPPEGGSPSDASPVTTAAAVAADAPLNEQVPSTRTHVTDSSPDASSLLAAMPAPSYNLPTARPASRSTPPPPPLAPPESEVVAAEPVTAVAPPGAAQGLRELGDDDGGRTPDADEDVPWFSLTPSPTPKPLAAVTALADLQQRLSGSKNSVDALTRRARVAEDALAEKQALVDALAQRVAELEAERLMSAASPLGLPATVTGPASAARRISLSGAIDDEDAVHTPKTREKAVTSAETVPAAMGGDDVSALPGGEQRPSARPRLPPPPPTPPPSARAPAESPGQTASPTQATSLEQWRQSRLSAKDASPPLVGTPVEAEAGAPDAEPHTPRTTHTGVGTMSASTSPPRADTAAATPVKPALVARSAQTSPLPRPAVRSVGVSVAAEVDARAVPSTHTGTQTESPHESSPVASESASSDAAFQVEQWQNVLEGERDRHAAEKAQLEHRLRELSAERSRERAADDTVAAQRAAHREEVAALDAALTRNQELLRAARGEAQRAQRDAESASQRVAELTRALRASQDQQAGLHAAVRAGESKVQEADEARRAVEAKLRKLAEEATVRRAQRDEAEKARRESVELVWAQARATRHALRQERGVMWPWLHAQLDLFTSAVAASAAEAGQANHRRRTPPCSSREASSSDTTSPASSAPSRGSPPDTRLSPVRAQRHPRPRGEAHRGHGELSSSSSPSPALRRAVEAAEAAMRVSEVHEDPLGLQLELDRQRRRVRSLEEAVKQHEAVHAADQRTVRKLQHLLDVGRELGMQGGHGDGGGFPSPARVPQLPWALKASFLAAPTPPAALVALDGARTLHDEGEDDDERARRLRSRSSASGARRSHSTVDHQRHHAPTDPAVPSTAHGGEVGRSSVNGRGGSVVSLAGPIAASLERAAEPGLASPPPRRAGSTATGGALGAPTPAATHTLSAVANSRAAAASTHPRSRSRVTPAGTAPPAASATSADTYRQRYAALKDYL